jgi:C_GCAxxG_C_C family probable redox protein
VIKIATIMERSETARDLFLSGNNCAQSVLLSFAPDLDLSRESALRIAAGFGGGMGKLQGTCGAVTGAIMVLGLLQGKYSENNESLKSETYSLVKKLDLRFKETFGTTSCADLTGCDLNTAEGSERFKTEKVMEKVCAACVSRAVEVVESIKPG